MIKKVLLIVLVIGVIYTIHSLVQFTRDFKRGAPYIMDGFESAFTEACEKNIECEKAISANFLKCSNKHYIKDISIFTFEDELMKFMFNTYECIEHESGLELPSFGEYVFKEKANELNQQSI